jgi:phospholipase D1/2
VHFHSDSGHIVTGCVHHKIVVIDDALAFCGGIDLTHKRWDTTAHEPQHDGRCDAHESGYMPVHDTQLCVSGDIARDLADYLRDNWPAGEPPPDATNAAADLWPPHLHVDFENIPAAVSRTRPQTSLRSGAREIEALYLAAIGSTALSLYLENQYFTSTRIARAIANQCRREPALEGLLVGMERPKTPVELHTMGYGLTQFHDVLVREGVHKRVPLVAALCGETHGINMHSKLAIFDDAWLTVGSANLNRRSMGFDVECNLVLEARTEAHRERMRQLRNRLLGEHLALSPDEVEDAVRRHGLARLPYVIQRCRRLVPLRPEQLDPMLGPILAPLFDRDERLPLPTASSAGAQPKKWSAALMLAAIVTLTALSGGLAWKESLDVNLHADPCAERRPGAVEARICEVFEHFVGLAQ